MGSATTANKTSNTAATRPRVLIVEDEPVVSETIVDMMNAGVDCDMVLVDSIDSARKAMSEPFDLLLTDVNLPDGNGMSLLPTLAKSAPTASAIVITGVATVDTVVDALRHGAVDFMPKPFTGTQLVDRVRAALSQQTLAAKQARKLARLKQAVRRLNEARKTVSKKVDLLCNDLISAYGELSKQMDGVRTQDGFRRYIENAKDLEQLLCHSMDWLLRQLGYSNVAVWLASEEGEFQLGAYMKYTTPGDAVLTEALKRVLLPIAAREGFIKLDARELKGKMNGEEYRYVERQSFLAMNCTYLGEALASIVFFRDEATPFKDEDADVMQAVGPIFAVALASVVHDETGGDDDGDGGAPIDGNDDDNHGAFDEPPVDGPSPAKKKTNKKDDADWWKRGDAPPF